jgi:hypothetical protein
MFMICDYVMLYVYGTINRALDQCRVYTMRMLLTQVLAFTEWHSVNGFAGTCLSSCTSKTYTQVK